MSKPDLVLKARGRRAKFNRDAIIANVNGFWGRPSVFRDVEQYAHPTIEFNLGEGNGDTVKVVFQQHWLDGTTTMSRAQPSGFMRHEGSWSYCYGMRFEARNCEYKGSRKWIRRVLDLLDRASDVQVPGKRHGDDMLTLICQLRQLGVEIRIYNETLRLKRSKRYFARMDDALANGASDCEARAHAAKYLNEAVS